MKNRLYVGNLSFNSTTDTLRDSFAQFGEVNDVHMVLDRETGRPRGFAFVTMEDGAAAQKAISGMNGALLDGRALRVNEAEERSSGGRGGHRGWLASAKPQRRLASAGCASRSPNLRLSNAGSVVAFLARCARHRRASRWLFAEH